MATSPRRRTPALHAQQTAQRPQDPPGLRRLFHQRRHLRIAQQIGQHARELRRLAAAPA